MTAAVISLDSRRKAPPLSRNSTRLAAIRRTKSITGGSFGSERSSSATASRPRYTRYLRHRIRLLRP
jgi:hypothetical protein